MSENAEQKRLDEARASGVAVEEVGTLPERAAVGHGARGLQRQTATPGTTSPTTRRGRAPTAGARTAWPASATTTSVLCFALALWNGRDPILKERAVRAGQQRGQPRRGRQGVLLLPRLDADALVHEVPVQVSAGGLSVRRPRRDQPQPRQARTRVRAARHRRVRRQPLLRRLRRIREGGARRRADPDQRLQPRPGGGAAARAADAVVSQHLVVGGRRREAGRCSEGRRSPAMRWSTPTTATRCSRSRWRTTSCTATATCRCCSPRTRPTTRGSSVRPTPRPT